MSDHARRHEESTRSYHVSQNVRAIFLREQTRNWRRADRFLGSPRRYWVTHQRAYCRSLIRGDLVTHRRMFGVSHKHVQPGQAPAERTS